MKKPYLLLLAVALLVLGCDRWEHDFTEPQPPVAQTLTEFTQSFDTELTTGLQNNDFTAVMRLFNSSYLNSGVDKSARQDWFAGFVPQAGQTVSVDVQVSDAETSQVSYTVSLDNRTSETVIDYAYMLDGGTTYEFIGDQQAATVKQVAFAQLFTSVYCATCPLAEDKLHSLQTQYPQDLIYIEYHNHQVDPLDFGNGDLVNYYGLISTPVAVFQGQNVLSSSDESTLNLYQTAIDNITEQPAMFELTEVQVGDITSTNLNGSITVKATQSFEDWTNLTLNYVVIDRYIDQFTNMDGEPMHNTVVAKGQQALTSAQNNTNIDFSIDITTINSALLASNTFLPEDASLVVWVQRLDDEYNSETCQVFNAVQVDIQE